MKRLSMRQACVRSSSMLLALGGLAFAGAASAESEARVQIIHNAADPAAAAVDIYVDNELAIPDFGFRTSTPYLDLPAGQLLSVGVAGAGSKGPEDILASIPLIFLADQTYVVVANGVLDSGSFAGNPNGRSIDFTVFTRNGQEASTDAGLVEFAALHGSSDAPTVDIVARDVATLVDDASYGDFTGYLGVPAAPYIVDVTPGDDNETIVASFDVNLTGLEGGAAVVFASGFLDPSANQDGPAFGLFGALPNGTVVEFPAVVDPDPTARLQIIHNAADPAAEIVDIYLNGELTLDDFAFRTATPFIDFPAEVSVDIGVAPGNSTGPGDIIATIPVELPEDGTFVALANGVLDPSQFAENPDGRSIGFTLFATGDARESGLDAGLVDFFGVHGSTDAPNVDIVARDVATLLDNVSYGDISGYLQVPPAPYTLDVTPGNDNGTVVASFAADLSGLGGGSAVVFASGFLDPSANQDGPAFGLFGALANGTVVEFPAVVDPDPTARLQIIHNAADPAAEIVDIYLNGELTLDDFAFRTATPFIDFPAEVSVDIGVAPGNSTGPGDIIATIPVELAAGETYIATANGVLDPSQFAENPDGESTAFQLLVNGAAREVASDASKVEVNILHGVTDAASVVVRAVPGGLLTTNLTYGNYTDYLGIDPGRYLLFVRPQEFDISTFFFRGFLADASELQGQALTVVASGFVRPNANQNGEGFDLLAVLADGTTVELPGLNPFVRLRQIYSYEQGGLVSQLDLDGLNESNVTESQLKEMERILADGAFDPRGLETATSELRLAPNSPNPFRSMTMINFNLPSAGKVTLNVYDISGRMVQGVLDAELPAGPQSVEFDGSELSSGIYYYELRTETGREVRKMTVYR